MENYTKRPKMHHKEGKSNVPTDKNMITQHFRHQNQIIQLIHYHPYTPVWQAEVSAHHQPVSFEKAQPGQNP